MVISKIRCWQGLLAGLCIMLVTVSASAQTVNASGLSGTLISAGVSDDSSGTAIVYTTPAKGHFVLTQAGGASQIFSVPSFGNLGSTACAPSTSLTFNPGLLIPQSTAISCTPASSCGFPYSCYIAGVLEK